MFQAEDLEFLKISSASRPNVDPIEKISDYAASKRILPTGTPFPGLWDNQHTPYLVEPMDNMSPWSPIQHTVVMKGPQLGFTGAAENVVCYWMDESPAPILFMSATDDLLIDWAGKRLEPAIDSCKFRHKIFAQTENTKTRRTGDNSMSKDYSGGFLIMSSSQSAAKMRANSVRILVRDEIDGSPKELRTGEGNWLEVSLARLDAWDVRKKIFDISTPTTFQRSSIFPAYKAGDCRKFLIPCPFCNKKQELVMGTQESTNGLKSDYEAGILKTAYYICDHCHEAFFNSHKSEFLKEGIWTPTTKSSDPLLRSYQISSLYSPVGMLSWLDALKRYEKGMKDPDKAQAATNLVLGMPFKETGSRPNFQKVCENRGDYDEGTVPDGVLFLTIGIDVQVGSKKDVHNPPRLEIEVLGTGAGYRTWSILYRRFEGEVTDPFEGAWEAMNKWALEGGLTFYRDDGMPFDVKLVFADCGIGVSDYLNAVYNFCERWQNTYPSKGFDVVPGSKKGQTKSKAGPNATQRYKATSVKSSNGQIIYQIGTLLYKKRIYNHLKIERQMTGNQKPGFCDFPIGRDDKYFKMLTAEDQLADGSFDAYGRRNEALDCRVYAACAADVYLDALVSEEKEYAKMSGASVVDLMQVNKVWVLKCLEDRILKKNTLQTELPLTNEK